MAMSLKKISAIAVGGAMVASTLASGVAASSVVIIGDVEGFMKNVVVDGEPNVEIVVGSKAAAMDVVSAADIAAKIGSMCYREVSLDIDSGSVDLEVKTSADTVLSMDLNKYKNGSQFLIFTTPEWKYTEELGNASILKGLVTDVNASIVIERNVNNGKLENAMIDVARGDIERGIINEILNRTTTTFNIGGRIDGVNIDTSTSRIYDGLITAIVEGKTIDGTIIAEISGRLMNGSSFSGKIIGTIYGNIDDNGVISGEMNGTIYITWIDRTYYNRNWAINGDIVGNVDTTSGIISINITNITGALDQNNNITAGSIEINNTQIIVSRTIRDMDISNANATFNGKIIYNDITVGVQKLSRLSTLVRDEDVDPDDVSNETDADAIEFLLASVRKEDNKFKIESGDLVYGTLVLKNDKQKEFQPLYIGMEIPLLGETYRVVSVDGKKIYLGKEIYSQNIEEGRRVNIGDGYEIVVKGVYERVMKKQHETEVVVDIEIKKNGITIKSESGLIPFKVIADNIIVKVYDAYKSVGGDTGYASVMIAKGVKEYELGKEFVKDWKLYAIIRDGNVLNCTDEEIVENNTDKNGKTEFLHVKGNSNKIVCGLALKYEGDAYKDLGDGKKVPFVNEYAILEFTNEGNTQKLFARYKMEETSKEISLELGGDEKEVSDITLKLKNIEGIQKVVEPIPIKTPIAKLDTEASLDTDKYLILVGGPVANKLSEELQKKGKINIDNDSPATIQVVDDRILVVAGGDRHRTREAALYLIENY